MKKRFSIVSFLSFACYSLLGNKFLSNHQNHHLCREGTASIKRKFKFFAMAAALSLFVTACPGDNPAAPETGNISGTVTADGSGLAGVTVTVSGPESATTTTDENGEFVFTGLASGSYVVTLSGFPSDVTFQQTSKSATLTGGADRVTVDFTGTRIDNKKSADTELSFTDIPEEPISVGKETEFAVTVKNNGPDEAVQPDLMIEIMNMNGQITQGPESLNCGGLPSHMTNCPLDNLLPGSEVEYRFILIPQEAGEVNLKGEVTHTSSDPNQENNSDEPTIIAEEQPNVLPIGSWPTPVTDPEYPFYAYGAYSQNGSTYKTFSKQADEVSFGSLTGTFITVFSGAEGYVAVDLLDMEVLHEETNLGGSGPFFGVAGATQDPPGANSPAMLSLAGASGYVLDRLDQAGPLELDGTTFDVFPAGGNPVTDVVSYVRPDAGVYFFVFDDSQNLYVPAEVELPVNLFDDNQLVSAYIHDDMLSNDPVPQPRGPVLVLTREAESGVYLAKWDGSDPVRAIDNIGFDARRLRCIDDGTGSGNLVCAASIFGHDRLGLMTWDGENEPVLTDFAEIGDGPVGIDLRVLESGNIAIVSTGFNDNTVTETIVAPNGRVESNSTRDAYSGCQSPGHAIYIQDEEGWKIVGTCYDSDNYFIIESEL